MAIKKFANQEEIVCPNCDENGKNCIFRGKDFLDSTWGEEATKNGEFPNSGMKLEDAIIFWCGSNKAVSLDEIQNGENQDLSQRKATVQLLTVDAGKTIAINSPVVLGYVTVQRVDKSEFIVTTTDKDGKSLPLAVLCRNASPQYQYQNIKLDFENLPWLKMTILANSFKSPNLDT